MSTQTRTTDNSRTERNGDAPTGIDDDIDEKRESQATLRLAIIYGLLCALAGAITGSFLASLFAPFPELTIVFGILGALTGLLLRERLVSILKFILVSRNRK